MKSGHVRFVVPSEICDMFEEWERKMGIAAHLMCIARSSSK